MSKTTIEETVEEFRKEYYGVKLGETQQFSDVNHRTMENFLRTALTTQKEELVKWLDEKIEKKRESYLEFGLREDEGELSAYREVKRFLTPPQN